jgi:hypothetical protein
LVSIVLSLCVYIQTFLLTVSTDTATEVLNVLAATDVEAMAEAAAPRAEEAEAAVASVLVDELSEAVRIELDTLSVQRERIYVQTASFTPPCP